MKRPPFWTRKGMLGSIGTFPSSFEARLVGHLF
jgi:hypothetical protein